MEKSSNKIKKIPYIETAHYQIRLTARYMKLLGEQCFEKMNINLSLDEFISIAVINEYGSMCQRDLAKLLLKDRANTGRIAQSLEKRGFIEIVNTTKNNRLIKNMVLTKSGQNFFNNTLEKIMPIIKQVESRFDDKDIENLINLLKGLREVMSTVLEVKM